MDGVESGYSAKTADPLRSCGAPVGMTRRGQLLFGRVATWMDGVEGGYSAKTADPLRSCGALVGVCDFIDFSRSWKHLSFLFSPSVFFENE
jgi:hypothetical protein